MIRFCGTCCIISYISGALSPDESGLKLPAAGNNFLLKHLMCLLWASSQIQKVVRLPAQRHEGPVITLVSQYPPAELLFNEEAANESARSSVSPRLHHTSLSLSFPELTPRRVRSLGFYGPWIWIWRRLHLGGVSLNSLSGSYRLSTQGKCFSQVSADGFLWGINLAAERLRIRGRGLVLIQTRLPRVEMQLEAPGSAGGLRAQEADLNSARAPLGPFNYSSRDTAPETTALPPAHCTANISLSMGARTMHSEMWSNCCGKSMAAVLTVQNVNCAAARGQHPDLWSALLRRHVQMNVSQKISGEKWQNYTSNLD